ncbi:MAG: hypothetical protein P4L41_00185 [Flavipsychrobacter sp.]|nr:hypothetical protein [Flavipsychrobacter sp.]
MNLQFWVRISFFQGGVANGQGGYNREGFTPHVMRGTKQPYETQQTFMDIHRHFIKTQYHLPWLFSA